jgi:hypothetical protein
MQETSRLEVARALLREQAAAEQAPFYRAAETMLAMRALGWPPLMIAQAIERGCRISTLFGERNGSDA